MMTKKRRTYFLELSQRELDIVASLCEMTVDATSVTFGDFADTCGTRIASRIRNRIDRMERET